MKQIGKSTGKEKSYFFLRIILPTLLSFCLFTISIFTIIIPSFEDNIVDRKREMIRELTNTAYSVIDEYYAKEISGDLEREAAQQECSERIRHMRYGESGKDYFWITDLHPVMIMHPYRPELENTDLADYQDPEGKRLFLVFVDTVNASGNGYVDYMWQWKDDSTRIVPKLSYVRGFEPWGWVIGTGIYIEDLREEIHDLTLSLVYASIAILLLLASLLFIVFQQSLRIEKKRQHAEEGLKESEARYRSLVEASTEGLVMYLDGAFVYANTMMLKMLGDNSLDNDSDRLGTVLLGVERGASSGADYFRSIIDGTYSRKPQEAVIRTVDGRMLQVLFTASPISLGDKSGATIIVRDVAAQELIANGAGVEVNRHDALMKAIRVGMFRTSVGKKHEFVDLNIIAAELFGFVESKQAIGTGFLDLVSNTNDRKSYLNLLSEHGKVTNHILPVQRQDGTAIILSVSAVHIIDERGEPLYIDAIVEDVTRRMKADEERENLIVELQASLHFLYEPVNHYIKDVVSCPMHWSVQKAATLMTRMKYSAILISSDHGDYIGVVTDRDIRKRVVAAGADYDRPVFEIMTSPVIIIRDNTLIFDAFLAMYENATRHLAVADHDNKVISLISSEELLQVQRHSSSFLLKEINNTASVEEIVPIQQRLSFIVKALVESGAKSKRITKIITSVSDAILNRLIDFAIEELGPPPVAFAFMALGSQGREEQTLHTDQDNAIVYEDVADEDAEIVTAYFNRLAGIVCRAMDRCGYQYCPGDSMAMNPRWNQSVSTWKDYYTTWIHQSDPQDLLTLSIFFDFRCVYGEERLTSELRSHLFKASENQSGFFLHLTKNSLLHKPPVGLLGNIQLESKGDHPETFNIKNTLMPISDFARLYAIRHAVTATNTIDRYEQLRLKGVIQDSTYQELQLAYNYLTQMRLRHQTMLHAKNLPPDNAVSLDELTQIEQKTLKNTFSQIISIQKALSYVFTGEAL
jgi:PAS domain S-box-containing protein